VLEMTRHAAEQGKHLVSRLMSFSRRQNLAPEIVELPLVSRSLDAMLAPTLGGLVTLKWELQPDLWNIYVDSSQLELALMNLVINSRDAMPSGGEIRIALANHQGDLPAELPAGDYVAITVSDTGLGIPPELVTKVLEPFFTTKEVGQGTGLGLSMAHGFARQSGGTLRITSSPGNGTKIDVWLPRSKAQKPVQQRGRSPEETPQIAGSAAHILLVDDSQTMRNLTEMQLIESGYAVTRAASGVEAVALIGQNPGKYDLLLTDYAMPMMSGLELVEAARRQHPLLPAVIVTGYADLEAIVTRPADVSIVAKPFTVADLTAAISSRVGIKPVAGPG
jgi:CheY-like chemotaxis protein/anti-sigma regulatory factor (Ser/Thr protein kinase)